MRLSLRNIHIHPSLSDETVAFDANLLLDGAVVARVVNRGTGGCHECSFNDRTVRDEIERYAAEWAKNELGSAFEALDALIDVLLAASHWPEEYAGMLSS